MSLPFDDLFGDGATNALTLAGTIDGESPSIIQSQIEEDKVLVNIIWPSASQQVVFNKTKLNASWGFGLCDVVADPEFLKKFAAAVFGPIGLAFGLKTASVRAPGETAAPFLAIGLKRSPDDPELLIGELDPNSPLGKWANGYA